MKVGLENWAEQHFPGGSLSFLLWGEREDNGRGWGRRIRTTSRKEVGVPEPKQKSYMWLRGKSRYQKVKVERKVKKTVEQ